MVKLSLKDKAEIRKALKSDFDEWISLPEDFHTSITHIIKFRPKNFTTLSIDEIDALVQSKFAQNEPLLTHLSPECLRRLSLAIRSEYYSENITDVLEGRDGLLVPTFVEIMSGFIFWVRDKNLKDLKNQADKEFYHKYFWCFELNSLEMLKYLNKAA